MMDGFKTFIMRGNVVDLAIGVVIGAAFTNIVNSLVKDIITPFAAAIMGQPDFTAWAVTLNGSKIMIGNFVNSAVSFLLIALVIYYFVVLPLNRLMAKAGRDPLIKIDPNEGKKE